MKRFSLTQAFLFFLAASMFYGCKSTGTTLNSVSGGFVYSLRNVELKDEQLLFSFKNCSKNKIKSFTVYCEFSDYASGDENIDTCGLEKTFTVDILPGERMDFSIELKTFEKLETEYEDFLEKLDCENIYVDRIYAKEIVFETINEDNSKSNLFWKDPYGSWYF